MNPRLLKKHAILAVAAVCALAACGCGTLIPGPRYMVTVDDYAFGDKSSSVLYLEDRYRFYPVVLTHKDGRALYVYDRESRKHRRVAETDAFAASPSAPLILYAPPWRGRFTRGNDTPDFYLLNYRTGERNGYFMPAGFDRDYLSYGFVHVDWQDEGPICAWVNFRYCPGEKPPFWKGQRARIPEWRTSTWKVVIDPAMGGKSVAEASPVESASISPEKWRNARRRKFISPDGREILAFSKYRDYLSFNSTLSVENHSNTRHEPIVREHVLLSLAQAGKYILFYLAAAPFLGLNNLL